MLHFFWKCQNIWHEVKEFFCVWEVGLKSSCFLENYRRCLLHQSKQLKIWNKHSISHMNTWIWRSSDVFNTYMVNFSLSSWRTHNFTTPAHSWRLSWGKSSTWRPDRRRPSLKLQCRSTPPGSSCGSMWPTWSSLRLHTIRLVKNKHQTKHNSCPRLNEVSFVNRISNQFLHVLNLFNSYLWVPKVFKQTYLIPCLL